ncbi:hypothetical protein [Nocardia sp. CA-290969]|uniref:hypothetical protein n=1 Tax=Nocardia sp. CA-290969 TaxID=3239986 RepID=UPI003D8B0459
MRRPHPPAPAVLGDRLRQQRIRESHHAAVPPDQPEFLSRIQIVHRERRVVCGVQDQLSGGPIGKRGKQQQVAGAGGQTEIPGQQCRSQALG